MLSQSVRQVLQVQLFILALLCPLSAQLSAVSKPRASVKLPQVKDRVVGPQRALIYDTTLRDGTQGEGISMSVEDKLSVFDQLVDFGFDYVEGKREAVELTSAWLATPGC